MHWRYARKQIGLFTAMAYRRLRDSGVRVLTYVDDVLQSDPFSPGLGATKNIIFDVFWVNKIISKFDWSWHFAYR